MLKHKQFIFVSKHSLTLWFMAFLCSLTRNKYTKRAHFVLSVSEVCRSGKPDVRFKFAIFYIKCVNLLLFHRNAKKQKTPVKPYFSINSHVIAIVCSSICNSLFYSFSCLLLVFTVFKWQQLIFIAYFSTYS